MNAYSVNHMTRSIILTHKFAKAASIPGTDEYKIFLSLRRDNPEYEVLQRTIAKKEGKRKAKAEAEAKAEMEEKASA